MSILIAIGGNAAPLVATDSRVVEPDGTIHDDWGKTFRLNGVRVIGGYTGLVRFKGRRIPDLLQTLDLETISSLEQLADQARALLETELASISESEVTIKARKLDVVVLGYSEIRKKKGPPIAYGVVIRPKDSGVIEGEIRQFDRWAEIGRAHV